MEIRDMIFTTGRGTPATDSYRVAQQTGRAHKNIRKSVKRLMGCGYETHFYEVKDGNRLVFVMDKTGFEQVTRTLPGIDEWRKSVLRLFDGESVPNVVVDRAKSPDSIELALAVREDCGVQYISARLLHSFLQVGTDFPGWFKYRCKQYDLARGTDFEVLSIAGNSRLHNDFFLTIDTAKELCMVENNERGKLARRYFIEVEKRFRRMTVPVQATPAVPQTFADALRLAASQAETIERQSKRIAGQEERIAADAPKVAFADAIIASQSSCGIDELSKIIAQNGVDIGEIRLFAWLRENGYLCAHGTARNQPTQKALEMKLFEILPQTWRNPRTGETMTTTRTMVTGKGKQYFVNRFVYNRERGM